MHVRISESALCDYLWAVPPYAPKLAIECVGSFDLETQTRKRLSKSPPKLRLQGVFTPQSLKAGSAEEPRACTALTL